MRWTYPEPEEPERMDDPEVADRCAAETGVTRLQEIEVSTLYIKRERETCPSSRVAITLSILGRRTGSSCQQRFVMSQIGSLKSGSCGRSGRSPSMISETATRSANSLNGHFPVKTLSSV